MSNPERQAKSLDSEKDMASPPKGIIVPERRLRSTGQFGPGKPRGSFSSMRFRIVASTAVVVALFLMLGLWLLESGASPVYTASEGSTSTGFGLESSTPPVPTPAEGQRTTRLEQQFAPEIIRDMV